MRFSDLRRGVAVAACVAGTPWAAAAQRADQTILPDTFRRAWVPPLASAVLPGTGQFVRRHDRGAVYLAAEVFLLTRFFGDLRQGRRDGAQFRDLAFAIARQPFGPSVRDTTFEYFEQMERFVESGPFSTDAGANLMPPVDPLTYNGAIWALARRTYFSNPDSAPSPTSDEYQRAIEFYRRRAIGPGFRWTWRDAGLEQDLFRQSIRGSDEAFRRAYAGLGLLLANHLLSVVDAYVSERLSHRNGSVGFRWSLWPLARSGGTPDLYLVMQVGF